MLDKSDAGWSSLVARRAHNPKVVGSNPAPATNPLLDVTSLHILCDSIFLLYINYETLIVLTFGVSGSTFKKPRLSGFFII